MSIDKDKHIELLNEKHQQVQSSIKNLQTIEKGLFKNLEQQKKGDNQKQILDHISQLSSVRENLFKDLKNEYDKQLDNHFTGGKRIKEQTKILNISEKELNNKKKEIMKMKELQSNRRKMVEIGNYEFERYEHHKKVMKIIAYTSLGVLISVFLIKSELLPPTIAKVGIVFSSVLGIIYLIYLLISMWYRNNLDYSKFDFGIWYEPSPPNNQPPHQESRWSINKRGMFRLLGFGVVDEDAKEEKSAKNALRKQTGEPPLKNENVKPFEEQLHELFDEDNCPPEAKKGGYCNTGWEDDDKKEKFSLLKQTVIPFSTGSFSSF